MKVTLEDTALHAVYMSSDKGSDSGGQRLAYLLKRLLLSHSNSEGTAIQTATVQCIVLLLGGPLAGSFSVTILKADIAGSMSVLKIYVWITRIPVCVCVCVLYLCMTLLDFDGNCCWNKVSGRLEAFLAQELISYHYSSCCCCCCCCSSSFWGNGLQKSQDQSFRIGLGWNLAGLFLK